MIVCEDSFADGIPETFRDWDRTAVPEEDAQQPAVNGMAINPEVYITDIAFRETIGKAPEERGIQVEYPALCLWQYRIIRQEQILRKFGF